MHDSLIRSFGCMESRCSRAQESTPTGQTVADELHMEYAADKYTYTHIMVIRNINHRGNTVG